MKRKQKSVLAGILALALIGGTFAYFNKTQSIDNKLATKEYGSELVEKFTPGSDFEPGVKVDKQVSVDNTGDYPLYVRVKLDETWSRGTTVFKNSNDADENKRYNLYQTEQAAHGTDANPTIGATDGLVEKDKSVVIKELVNTGDWIVGADGYYYYKQPLASKGSTSKFMNSVALLKDVDLGVYSDDVYYTTLADDPGPVVTAEDAAKDNTKTVNVGAGKAWTKLAPGADIPQNATFSRTRTVLDPARPGYAGAEYVLTVTTEVIQTNLEKSATAATSIKDYYFTLDWKFPSGTDMNP